MTPFFTSGMDGRMENRMTEKIYRYSLIVKLIPVLLALEIFLFGAFFYFYPPVAFRSEALSSLPFFVFFRLMIFVVTSFLAFWIFRFSSQLRPSFQLGEDAMIVYSGAFKSAIRYDSIESIDYENMLGQSKRLFGSVILRVKHSGVIRVYNLLGEGERFIEEFVSRVTVEPYSRDDLKIWIDVRRIDRKMGLRKISIRIWYYFMIILLVAFVVRGYLL